MALEIRPKLLKELRLRVLVYDRARTPENHDRLIAAARAVSVAYIEAHDAVTRRQTARRHRQAEERVEHGLCRSCGSEPHRPGRVTCIQCGLRAAEYARTLRRSLRREA